ncbi:hypothetical protein C9I92_21850 [Photobacterium ganghwense]|uniref:Peptidase S74 domain-containing protein n=1 Tax=Photobacterium ganghwense TaxID=320778 RepID=A0A0J1HEZ6_9GAMM|nr:tail fiber domain-containing protein [Photobacterium ganghwense]KLV10183.1 hypothetical protein ABT57_06295 [Photobacterium ganghwense]PSU05433.1 hypothetical protein C9I92_21850 [Photobacterium ganghwense]
MQNYTEITENTNLRASLPQILNNDKTALSNSSGIAWPTTPPPSDGRTCYRSDQKKLYMYADGGWKMIIDFAKTPLSVQDADAKYAAKSHNHDSAYARKAVDETFAKSVTITTNLTVGGIIYNTSDMKAKTDIRKITGALGKVKQLGGYTYKLKASGQASVGVLAQEVEAVDKHLVFKEEDKLAVNYNGLVAVLIEAVNELAQKVEKLEKGH